MNFSKYQQTIFDTFASTEANLSIVAVAGSGKSTTLEELVSRIPWENSVLVVAFNKDIVTDLTPRMRKHPMCQVMTLNSFGYRILRQGVKLGELNDDKAHHALSKSIEIGNENLYYKWRHPIKRLMDLFRANLVYRAVGGTGLLSDAIIEDTMAEYGIDPPYTQRTERQFHEAVRNTWGRMLLWSNIPDYRDQVFMPIYLGLPIPQYDVVLVDEDQDLDACQAELVCQAARRLVMVGDPDQAIYRFRGAMPDAVNQLEKRMSATRLPLSVCYRCPRTVIERAKKLVPQIEPCDWAPEGQDTTIRLDEFRKTVSDGAMCLCRCTKPLVSECLHLIRLGKRAKVKGREIGTQLKSLIEKLSVSPSQSLMEFAEALNSYYLEQMERLSALGKDQQIIDLSDRVETIRVIMESSGADVGSMLAKIDTIFSDNPDAKGIVLMTCHKAKGLEANKVYILAPELLPHPAAKSAAAQADERRLLYVAITRVKFTVSDPGSLFWVVS